MLACSLGGNVLSPESIAFSHEFIGQRRRKHEGLSPPTRVGASAPTCIPKHAHIRHRPLTLLASTSPPLLHNGSFL